MPKQKTMTELLRKALNDAIESGSTFRDLERETGVIRQSLMPFARGECSLRLDKADALAKYFRLELQPAKRKESA
jgi:hypothetical protein